MKPRLMLAAAGLAVISAAAIAQAAPQAAPAEKVRFNPDTNNDGYLNRAEAQAAAEHRFARMDANSDGKLLPDERPARRAKEAKADQPAPPAGDEAKKEGRRHHWRGGHHGGFGMGPVSFEENDANKDGALSIDEFRSASLRLFDATDGNRDGRVKLPEHHKRGEKQPG